MDSTVKHFNFHEIATASIRSNSSFADGFFYDEYRYHSADTIANQIPNVQLNYQLNKPIPADYTQYRHKLLSNLGFTCELSHNKVDLSIVGNKIAVPIAHHMLLHSSIRWLAANHTSLLLHAGSVAKNNKSIIFSGKGGAGKTTTTSLILSADDGWQIHADDYIFLRDRESLAYVTRSHLYKDLLSWVPEVGVRLTNWEKVKLEFLGQVRKRTMEGIKWPVRLSTDRLWPDVQIADTAIPAAILLLERDHIEKPTMIEVENKEEAIADLIDMNFYEARHFLFLLKKAGIHSDGWEENWRDLETQTLTNFVKNTPILRFVLPYYSDTVKQSNELLASINSLVN